MDKIIKAFCCEPMELLVEDLDCPLKYRSWTRQYVLTIPQDYLSENEVCVSFTITHCPRCGAQLPSNLIEEWFNLIEEKFGIKGLFDERTKDLPQEFKTDEWWKKRGL